MIMAGMSEIELARIAELLQKRNALDAEIAGIIGRPMTAGHLGEWIASQIFDIELEASAVSRAIDGRFHSGPLQGRSVNVKWYLKREGLLDTTSDDSLDYYLVLAGPPAPPTSSRGTIRPWCVQSVHLSTHASCVPSRPAGACAKVRLPACSRRNGPRPRSTQPPAIPCSLLLRVRPRCSPYSSHSDS